MNPFYDLNKKLDGIRNEPTQEQKALVESQASKSPAKKTLEEALRSDLRSLMEDATGGMSGSNTLESSMPDYLYLSGKIGDLFIKLYDQGKIFSHEDFEKIKDRVAKYLGYSLGDRIFEKAWLEATSEPNLDNDDSDYTDYSMQQGEMGRYNESKDKSLSQAAKTVKKGALHKQEGIPQGKKIGDKKLNSLKKSGTPLEKKRANFALNIQGKGKKSVDESIDECNECMMGECIVHDINELSHGAVVGYKTGAQQDLRKLKQQPVDDFVSNMRQGHRIGDAANMAVQNNIKAIKKAKNRGAGLDRANARLGEEYEAEGATTPDFKPGDKVIWKYPSGRQVRGIFKGMKDGVDALIYSSPNTYAIPLSNLQLAQGDQEYRMEEGATPNQLDQQKMSQMKRAAATRSNSRAVQQQPAQGGPRRAEVPAFIRKGRGDPVLDHTDLEETDMYSESDKDILDYLKAKLVPNGGNPKAKSRPYNGSAGDADAYNGMEFEEAESRFDKREVSPGRTQYTRKYDPDTGHSIGSDTGSPAASDGPRKRGRQPGTKFSGGYAARHDGSHVSKAKMDSRKKDMDEEDEYSRHTASKSPAGGTVYTRKYDPDTGHSIGSDTSTAAASDGPRKRGRQPGTKFSGGYAARHDGSHVSKAKMNSRKKDMDEDSATCPHCGHAMADEGREVDMEGVKGGMGHFVKAAKKVGGIAKVLANRDYDGDGKKETSKAEHAGVVDKAIKASKSKTKSKPAAKSADKSADKPKAKSAEKTEEGNAFGKAVSDAKKDGIQKGEKVKVGGKEYPVKEEKVEETTTGSVATAPAKKSSGGSGVGKGIYDSWERKYESLLKEDVNITTSSNKGDDGEEHENISIEVTGDDVARIKEMLHSMGVSHGDEAGHEHGGEEACDSCGGVPCQCDEMDEGINNQGGDAGQLVQDYYDGKLDWDDFFSAAVDMTRVNGKINTAGVDKILRHLHDPEKSNEPITYDMVMRHARQDGERSNFNYGDDDHQAYNSDTDYPSKDIPKTQFEDGMEETTSFKDAGATVGRIGGTIAGGLGGAAAGLGIGTVPGAVAGGIAGGSAGSALGTAAGSWLDKKTGAPEETDESMGEHQRMMELAGLGETSIIVSDNEPDYPSNQEYSNDEMQYSGGLNRQKTTGQSTLPVVASQVNRLHSHVSEGQRMNDLYRAIQAIENKEV